MVKKGTPIDVKLWPNILNCIFQKCNDTYNLFMTRVSFEQLFTSYTFFFSSAIVDEMLKPEDFITHVVNAEFLGATQLGDRLLESFKENVNDIVRHTKAEDLAKMPGAFSAEAMKAMHKVLERNEAVEQELEE